MKRRAFIKSSLAASTAILPLSVFNPDAAGQRQTAMKENIIRPLAITMWEFSWLERRWPGAGYEDWDQALSELVERGYDAIRIDAFPHLVAAAPEKKWGINPHWDTQDWGSPVYTEIQVQPHLNRFIKKCQEYQVKIGLSTWWREDTEKTASKIQSGTDLGRVWKKTLESIQSEGLLDNILYVDLSNEYSIEVWTPYLPPNTARQSETAMQYMRESIDLLKAAFPNIPFCFSITTEYENWQKEDVSRQDLLELHIWIANSSEFNEEVGYGFQRFGYDDYKELQLNGEKVYRAKETYWLDKLRQRIDLSANWSKKAALPVITTECWGPIDYKDMPLLDWGWVKEACSFGVRQAAKTGRWAAIATSNFCGPQFVGMWRDIEWHKELTTLIKNSPIDAELHSTLLLQRMARG